MKALILGAGFGTRLERDLKSPDGEFYSHLIGVPKPLLPIGKYPLATHWLLTMSEIRNVEDIYVVVCYSCIVTIIGIEHAFLTKCVVLVLKPNLVFTCSLKFTQLTYVNVKNTWISWKNWISVFWNWFNSSILISSDFRQLKFIWSSEIYKRFFTEKHVVDWNGIKWKWLK